MRCGCRSSRPPVTGRSAPEGARRAHHRAGKAAASAPCGRRGREGVPGAERLRPFSCSRARLPPSRPPARCRARPPFRPPASADLTPGLTSTSPPPGASATHLPVTSTRHAQRDPEAAPHRPAHLRPPGRGPWCRRHRLPAGRVGRSVPGRVGARHRLISGSAAGPRSDCRCTRSTPAAVAPGGSPRGYDGALAVSRGLLDALSGQPREVRDFVTGAPEGSLPLRSVGHRPRAVGGRT